MELSEMRKQIVNIQDISTARVLLYTLAEISVNKNVTLYEALDNILSVKR